MLWRILAVVVGVVVAVALAQLDRLNAEWDWHGFWVPTRRLRTLRLYRTIAIGVFGLVCAGAAALFILDEEASALPALLLGVAAGAAAQAIMLVDISPLIGDYSVARSIAARSYTAISQALDRYALQAIGEFVSDCTAESLPELAYRELTVAYGTPIGVVQTVAQRQVTVQLAQWVAILRNEPPPETDLAANGPGLAVATHQIEARSLLESFIRDGLAGNLVETVNGRVRRHIPPCSSLAELRARYCNRG